MPPVLVSLFLLVLMTAAAATDAAGDAPGEPSPRRNPAVELQKAFAAVAEKTLPSTVGISIFRRDPTARPESEDTEGWQERPDLDWRYPGYLRVGGGAGFFLTADGYIVTCHHRLIDPASGEVADLIDIEMFGDQHERARLVGSDPTIDFALLKTEGRFEATPVEIGDDGSLQTGYWVIAVANPPGVARTFVPGTVAATPHRDCYQEHRTSTLIQTSLSVDPVSFGGPLVDLDGKVVAVSVPRRVDSWTGDDERRLAAYGLPVSLVMTLFEPLKLKESRRSPWIGVAVLNLTRDLRAKMGQSPSTGIYVENVFDPSPAHAAGIRPGDVLVRMGDRRLLSARDFQSALYFGGIGTETTVEVFRGGETFEKRIVIQQRPPGATAR